MFPTYQIKLRKNTVIKLKLAMEDVEQIWFTFNLVVRIFVALVFSRTRKHILE